MASELFRLSASHIKLATPLPGNVMDESGKLLLSKGYVITDQETLDRLLGRGMYVDLATFEAQYKHPESSEKPAVQNQYDPFAVHSSLKARLTRLLRGVLEKTVRPDEIVELAGQIIEFADHDSEAAVAATLLDRHEEVYPVGHSLHAAVLCAIVSRLAGWADERRRSVVCAGMTMNLGMLEYHQRMHRQAGALSPPQLEQLHTHPERSVALVREIGVADEEWLAAIRDHHECADGKGYYHRTALGECSQLLRFADVFDARSNDRADRKALAPAMVIRKLFVDEKDGAGGSFAAALIKLCGLFPPGSFVRLANQEQAVVFRHGAAANAPVVASVTSASGVPLMQPIRRDTQRKDYAITGTFVPERANFGFDIGRLWVGKS